MLLTIHHPWPDPHPAAPEQQQTAQRETVARVSPNAQAEGRQYSSAFSLGAATVRVRREISSRPSEGAPREIFRVNPALCIGFVFRFCF